MSVHTFAGEMERQKEQSARWVEWYSRHFHVVPVPATPEEDLAGVDFWADWPHGRVSIQLKVDFKSDEYHNFFLERRIEDANGRRPGWCEKLDADEYWFVQPEHNHLVFVTRDALAGIYEAAKVRQRLLGPVVNIGPWGRWDAYGYAVKVSRFISAGEHFELSEPRPIFSEGR